MYLKQTQGVTKYNRYWISVVGKGLHRVRGDSILSVSLLVLTQKSQDEALQSCLTGDRTHLPQTHGLQHTQEHRASGQAKCHYKQCNTGKFCLNRQWAHLSSNPLFILHRYRQVSLGFWDLFLQNDKAKQDRPWLFFLALPSKQDPQQVSLRHFKRISLEPKSASEQTVFLFACMPGAPPWPPRLLSEMKCLRSSPQGLQRFHALQPFSLFLIPFFISSYKLAIFSS